MSKDNITTNKQCNLETRDDSTVDIPFHRHCQATLCSASGTDGDGTGLTWNYISSLEQQLINLPTNWVRTYFLSNKNCITQDFASVLKLIDYVSGNTCPKFTIGIKDATGTFIDNHLFNPSSEGESQYSYQFGRILTLSIDGNTVSFNTLRQDDTNDSLQLTLPKKTISITKNGSNVGSVQNVYMTSDSTVDVSHDYITIPLKEMSSNTITPDTNNGIYHISISSNQILTIGLPTTNSSEVCQFEVHVTNTGSSSVTIGFQASGVNVMALTNQMSVQSGKTNAYTIRYHNYNNKFTYRLDYVY